MSDSIDPGRGGERSAASPGPRAVIHKKILEAAEARPDASYDELADAVSGASADLVERVIDEYGDPADEDGQADEDGDPTAEGGQDDANDHQNGSAEPPTDTDETMSTTDAHTTDDAHPDLEQLTDRQERVFRAVYDRPDATQEEIAAQFDVSAATISQRVNAIDGFDWSRRRAFVESLFENGTDAPPEGGSASRSAAESESIEARPGTEAGTEADSDPASPGSERESAGSETAAADPEPHSDDSETAPAGSEAQPRDPEPASVDPETHPNGDTSADADAIADLSAQVDDLAERVAALEGRIAERSPPEGAFSDPDLVSKMVHACMESERVTEEEELRILRGVMTTAEPTDS
ncbi:hypothetical protein G9464_12695 [Halostella sp. JP-L12]|uniref:sigma factor-like helix-turn-helix DNA-binding protein n=1 Tax=Halostella TaxID=1843185 RepID=UPI000EF8183B|nr:MULTISPECIES: sigma factor-like helix-turn-helix DNA-binding protein [Halostella]NHN48446.1 hypothetical protein [Halostella sp. JP-L12]